MDNRSGVNVSDDEDEKGEYLVRLLLYNTLGEECMIGEKPEPLKSVCPQ